MTKENIEQDLQFIKHVLENNRKLLADNGIFYILWGAMVVSGTFITYLLIHFNLLSINPFFWLGYIILFYFIRRFIDKKTEPKQHVVTFGWKLFGAVWFVCGATIIILTIFLFTTKIVPITVFLGVISGIFGIAYYLSGIINDIKFLKKLTYAWWLGMIILISWEYLFDLYYIAMFFAALILFLQVIPGIIIYKKWKRDYA